MCKLAVPRLLPCFQVSDAQRVAPSTDSLHFRRSKAHAMSDQLAFAPNAAAAVTLTEFMLFPKLAPELRLMIWKYAIPGPRIIKVDIRTYDDYDRAHDQDSSRVLPTLKLVTGIPAVLHVNVESRVEALKVYKLTLENHFSTYPLYMDFTRDVLLIEPECFTKLFPCHVSYWKSDARASSILRKLQHIMLREDYELALDGLTSLPALKTLVVADVHEFHRHATCVQHDGMMDDIEAEIHDSRITDLGAAASANLQVKFTSGKRMLQMAKATKDGLLDKMPEFEAPLYCYEIHAMWQDLVKDSCFYNMG